MTDDDRKFSLKVIAAAILILLAGWVGMALMGWDDAVYGQVELVTDYAAYPDTAQAQLPDGCDGAGVLGVAYSLNGSPEVADPGALPQFNAGDTLTMTWDSTTAACVDAPIVLVVKVAQDPVFDPGDDQFAFVPYAATAATGGPGSLTYVLPGLEQFGFNCNYQLDSIVGLPLAIVGPNGSFYSASLRGDDRRTTLIGFRNGAYESCEAPPTTTTTGPPTTTTTPSTTVPTTVPPTVPADIPCGSGDETLGVAVAECALADVGASGEGVQAGALPASSSLPATGSRAGLIPLGLLILAAGALIFVATRKAAKSS